MRLFSSSPAPALQTSGAPLDLPLCGLPLSISAATLDLASSIATLDFLVSITGLPGHADSAFLPRFTLPLRHAPKLKLRGYRKESGAPFVHGSNAVIPDVAEPPPVEVMVTRFGGPMLENVMAKFPGAGGTSGPITPVQGCPVA